MAKRGWGNSDFGDVQQALIDTQEHYGIKARISIVPRPRTGYEEGCIVLVTPYKPTGAKLAEVPAEQALWPSSSRETTWGIALRLLIKLQGALDEWQHRAAREAQMAAQEELTPLEQYIAGSF